MKRVRALVGAAGLTPAVLGVAVPTAASAAAAPATGTGKTVSLDHAAARAGCTARDPFTLPLSVNRRVKGHGWYLKSPHGWTCIGTVVISVYTSQTGNDCPGVDVFDDRKPPDTFNSAKTIAGTRGQWVHHSFGVHEYFHHLAQVVGYSCYLPGSTSWFTVNNGT